MPSSPDSWRCFEMRLPCGCGRLLGRYAGQCDTVIRLVFLHDTPLKPVIGDAAAMRFQHGIALQFEPLHKLWKTPLFRLFRSNCIDKAYCRWCSFRLLPGAGSAGSGSCSRVRSFVALVHVHRPSYGWGALLSALICWEWNSATIRPLGSLTERMPSTSRTV